MDLRRKLLGKKQNVKKTSVEWEGETLEVRQPTVASRREIFNKSKKDGEVDGTDLTVWSVIYNVYDPETGKRVFEETDFDTLLDQPSGGLVDVLGEAAINMLHVDGVEKKSSTSEETQSDSA